MKNFITRKTCPVCNNNYKIIYDYPLTGEKIWPFLNEYYEGKIPRQKVNFNYCIAKCVKCGLLFQKDILSDFNMFLLYEEWISTENSLRKKEEADISLFTNYALEMQVICKILNKKPHEINVLDFGMGWSFWLNMARAFNFNVCGLEISKNRIEYTKKKGLRAINNISGEKDETYDYIQADNVFEHIPNPRKTIKELSRILKKGGVLHAKVPNGRKMEKKLKNKNWKALKDALHPLEHINCYNRKTLIFLARQANLVPIHPPYCLNISSIKSLFTSHLRYFKDLFYSTNLYFKKKK